jgi:cation transport ATPase
MSPQTAREAVAAATGSDAELELAVTGMTCGSCSARVERTLAEQPGVEEVVVNLATERATVRFDPSAVSVDDMVAAVAKAGYGLAPVEPSAPEEEPVDHEAAAQAKWLRRVIVAWPLAIAVLVLSMRWMHEEWARWWAQPHHRRGGHGLLQRVGGDQQPSPGPLPRRRRLTVRP